jgi:hypothetical protein
MREWKKIDGFEYYSISNDGIVRNDKRQSIVKPMLSTSGYLFVHLVKERKKYTKYIHRLVGLAFLERQTEDVQIDHIDGDKTNNALSNLRWVTVSENCKAYGSEQRAEARKRGVTATHTDGTILEFDSRKSAAEHFNCSPTKIKYGHLYAKGDKQGWTFKIS